VLGCVAQQEGEKIFERAPYVSLVSGSASYRKLPEMLTRLEAGENRITGLDDRQTDETFETEFTARQNPYRGYITIIEGCDKFCAYCVVPYTRGKERSRTSSSVLAEARRIADLGYTEIQLLGQNVNSYRDPEGKRASRNCWPPWARWRDPPRALHHQPPARLYPRHRRGHRRRAHALRPRAPAGAVGLGNRVLKLMAREYTPEWYLERIAWIKAARRPISLSTDIIVGFPGETPTISSRPWTFWPRSSTIASSVSSTRRGPTRRR
jgi:tRNA-2-methylthio-N6-dimethylallyladenosine synthase